MGRIGWDEIEWLIKKWGVKTDEKEMVREMVREMLCERERERGGKREYHFYERVLSHLIDNNNIQI